MTNLEHILKKLKHIEPEQHYADRSLHTIVMTPRTSRASWFSFTFFRVAEYGAAVALVGLLLVVMLGNSSLVTTFSPIQSNSLSSGGLRAEAEAIDIQIKLLDLDYEESSSTLIKKSTTPILRKKTSRQVIAPLETTTSTIANESTTPPTVDEVLDLLAE
ncbi:MAG: hypothetical protein AAB691_03190 [Patescibacteria group bacterium]